MKAGAQITKAISDFVVSFRDEHVSKDARYIAKRCIIDGIGVILAGSTEECTQIVLDYVCSIEGKKESSVLGKNATQTAAPFAALVNGTAGHSMDWDDTVLPSTPDRAVLVHPTLAPLAAGLAIGEKIGASCRELLTAFIVGFDVECKIAEAIHPDHWARGYHTSNTIGIFGACTTAAKMMGLPSTQVSNAIGIAASMASGLMVNFGTMVKPLHAGRAAESGITAAELAERGFVAHPEAMEAQKGFFHAFGGGFDPDKIVGKLGNPFHILSPGVSIKPYPCGVVGHPAMDGMKKLLIDHDIQSEQVEHVKVLTGSNILPPLGPLRYGKAQTGLQGKFSLPFMIASIIIRRKAGMMEFTDQFVQNPDVQAMMDRIETILDPEIDALGMDKIVNVIELHLKDGSILRGKSPENYRGGPRNPLSRRELTDKFNDCVQKVLNPKQAEKLLETIESLEKIHSVRALTALATGS